MSLKRLAVKGAIWNVGGGVAQTVIRLGASMVLARALDPFDFGIMGMGMMVLSFLMLLSNSGVGAAIIAKREYNHDDLSTAFWFMLIFRVLLFLIAFLCAPLFALFFHEPRLTSALRLMSFAFLISIFSAIPSSLLTKELKFSTINTIAILSVFLESLIAIFLAVKMGYRYWSLIIAMLIASLFTQFAFLAVTRWRPSLKFSWDSFRYYKKYITNCIGSSLMVYFLGNADYLIVSRFLGTSSLGYYEFSYRIPHLIRMRFAQPLSGVLFPTLAKSRDLSQSSYGIYSVIKVISIVSFTILIFLAVFSREIILFLWGEKWLEISPLFIIACIGALIECIMVPRSSIFLAHERPDLNFKMNFLHAISTIILVFLLTKRFGLIGTALGVLLGLSVPFAFFVYSLKIVNCKLRELIHFLTPLLLFLLLLSFSLKIFVFPLFLSLNFYFAVILTGLIYLITAFLFIMIKFSYFTKEMVTLLTTSF